MKTLLTIFAVSVLFVVSVFGIQRMLKSTLNIPLVYVASDGVVYAAGGGIDISNSVIMAIRKSDGTWIKSEKWPSVLKGRFETTFVAPEWVPPYVDQPDLLTSR